MKRMVSVVLVILVGIIGLFGCKDSKSKEITLDGSNELIMNYLEALSNKDIKELKKYSTPEFGKSIGDDKTVLENTLKSAELLLAKIDSIEEDRVKVYTEVEIICYDTPESAPAGDWINGETISKKYFELKYVDGEWKVDGWGA
ncbi:hypothetical protein [Clostridium sp. LP20]|uniref:hypothetical protein n=1 Tax=Clostridium sp. LP20 TaxID=3418665 RepID=UPI003EE4DAAF